MIRIQIDILDDDALTSAQVVQLFATDEEANEFLQDIERTKMQRIFDTLKAGEYSPNKIMTGSTLSYTPSSPSAQRYNEAGEWTHSLVDKKELYDMAANACYERTTIKITHN